MFKVRCLAKMAGAAEGCSDQKYITDSGMFVQCNFFFWLDLERYFNPANCSVAEIKHKADVAAI